MNAKQIKIKLSKIAYEATSNCSDEISCGDDTDLGQIVEVQPSGVIDIVDGFHRTAAQVQHCKESGIDPADYEITVVQTFDEQLIGDASEPGEKQEAAITEIYRQAGR